MGSPMLGLLDGRHITYLFSRNTYIYGFDFVAAGKLSRSRIGESAPIVIQIRSQPFFGFGEGEALALGVFFDLIFAEFADAEIF